MNKLESFLLIGAMVLSCGRAFSGPVPDAQWTYKNAGARELRMEVFLPEGYGEADKIFPALLFFHGGSWREGSPANHFPDCAYWAKRGMVAASFEYRLKDRDHVEVPLACLQDAKSAVRFLRSNADKLKIDPQKIVVAGDSAGGMMAAATAMIGGQGTDDRGDDCAVSCVPDAVMLHCPYWKTGCTPELSPPNHLREGLPPFIIFLGDSDQAIPVEGIKAFHESLRSKGNASEFHIGTGGKHGFTNGRNPQNKFFYWALGLQDDFLVRHGIIEGPSLVALPPGVQVLEPGKDFVTHE